MKTSHTLEEADIAAAITYWFENGCPRLSRPLNLSFYHYDAGGDPREQDYYTITVTEATRRSSLKEEKP